MRRPSPREAMRGTFVAVLATVGFTLLVFATLAGESTGSALGAVLLAVAILLHTRHARFFHE